MLLLCRLVDLYLLAIFARIILSWFPLSPDSPLASVFSFLYTITEPILGPIRRALPPLGMFDLSPLIVLFAVRLLLAPALGC